MFELLTTAELQELITLHSVDAEGNVIAAQEGDEGAAAAGQPEDGNNGIAAQEGEEGYEVTGQEGEDGEYVITGDEVEVGEGDDGMAEHEEGHIVVQEGEEGAEHMDIAHDEEIQIEPEHDEHIDGSMMETDNIEEVIISSSTHKTEDIGSSFGESNSETHQFLSVQDSVFNPVTGTLQPISSVNKNASTPQPKTKKGKQQVKYVIGNQSGDGTGQLVLDASQLQSLLEGGGGNTITLSGASGKAVVLTSPQKSKVPKSPAKILPAPVPIGDQQVKGSPQRILLRQGNVLTPISVGSTTSQTQQLIQVGSGNQVQYLRLVSSPSKQVPLNKVPISPSKPKSIVTKPVTMVKSEHSSTPVPIQPSISLDSEAAAEQAMFNLQQNLAQQQAGYDSFRSLLEPNGMRPRKPCNCTKSQCLKLYCDCFANGEFCHLCNCTNCYNNLTHEEDRQKAIKLVLERNPGAFRPKIGKSSQTGEAHERRHNKGCNCRRSGCLKNYCECYEAKIFCSGICKCTGCKNCIENIPSGLPNGVGVEQHFAGAGTSHRQTLKDLAEAAEVRVQQQNQVKNKMKAQWQDVSTQNNIGSTVPAVIFRYPQGQISYEVITSTVDLLLAKASAGEMQRLGEGEQERVLIEEFGECLSALMELGTSTSPISHTD